MGEQPPGGGREEGIIMLADLVPNAVHGVGDLVVRMARNVFGKCSRIHVAPRAPLSLGQPLRTLEDVVRDGYGSFHTRSMTGAGRMRLPRAGTG